MTKLWPLFGLRLRTERLELRVPSDEDIAELAALAAEGVHPPDEMPFFTPWTDRPPGELERGVLLWDWQCRASWSPDDWNIDFIVALRDGTVVGVQGVRAKQFATARSVVTGSWLGQGHQGQGIGRQMRSAVLALAFDGLDALEAHSGAFADNAASAGVSRALARKPRNRSAPSAGRM